MQYEPTQILDQVTPVVRIALEQSFYTWQSYHNGRLNELESIFNSLKILLVHTEEWTEKPDCLWNELESEFVKLRLWTDSLKYVSLDDLTNKISSPLTAEFKKLKSEYPDELRILIGDTYWQIQPEDPFVRRIRKRWQPLKTTINSLKFKLTNKYRDFRHKPPKKSKAAERVIEFHSLLSYYIQNPLIQFLIDEWQRYLQAITGQLFVLQLNVKEFANKSLILDELPTILDPDKKNEIFNNMFDLAEVLKNVDENIQALKKYEEQFITRFEKIWISISERFVKAWDWAGTFQLKGKHYTGERLIHLEYSSKSRFNKCYKAWQQHFSALQGEWQRDTEIAILRYKVISNLYNISQSLHNGIREGIDPSFTQVKDILSKTSVEIEDTTEDSSFRSLITNKRKSILNALQILLETIHGVSIVRLLEDGLEKVQTAVNNLGTQHLAFLRQDTEKRPPHSISKSVPLKELVTKEISDPFYLRFRQLIETTEAEVKYILRVISEIDQQIEFNTDSTLKLIKQSGKLPVFMRAKNEMSEGLNRTVKLLIDLKINIANIPEKCIQELLQNSLEFERDLENFLDSERIFKFKSQLKQKRFINLIGDMGKKSVHLSKSVFTGLSKGSANRVKNLWSQYFSLSPAQTNGREPDIKEIQQYLTETEAKIAKLPFIYQKLFHFQALNDKQFFTNRIKEINILREEFKKWEDGKSSAVAVVGERGSGLTTFLNYAENEIYEGIALTRIVFAKPENGQGNILKIVCDAFHFKQLHDWADLEQKVKDERPYKICILENMQYMFLKTVSGFSGLEELLHFISRTKHVIFWITTCTLYSWQFLEKAIGIETHFQCLIRLHKITRDELKSIILKRHRASGYHLEFETSTNSRLKKKSHLSDENPQRAQLEDNYFKKLHEFAGGNITTAILIWLRSIKEFSKDKMVLSTKFEFDFTFLGRLSEERLLTLCMVLHHEILSPLNHSSVFNQNIDKSILQLENLEGEGLLIKIGVGYQIHPFVYRPLVQILRNMNILS
jgi:hypothetical protein